MPTVLITGGSGLVGGHLTRLLLEEGFSVRHLGRRKRPDAQVPVFVWDIRKGFVEPGALEGMDHIIHLSGAGIVGKRWTPGRMEELYASRAGAAELLFREAESSGHWPGTFISASGINYYGTATTDRVHTEGDPPADDTLGRLCQAWEKAAFAWQARCRVAVLRMPAVLAREGGALPKMAGPARWGVAAPFGSGKQWMPWAHVDDVARAYLFLVQHAELQGAFNLAAPEPVDNRTLVHRIAKALHRPCFLPAIPAVVLRAAMGEMASIILEGSRVNGGKLMEAGFAFRYPGLNGALADLLQ